MEPTVVDNPSAGRFEIMVDGQVAGFAEYRRRNGTISFTHTLIESNFEGRDLGSKLARGALDAVREEGSGVLPFCPFIRGYIQRHPDYLDLVPTDQRARFELAPASAEPDIS
ncbi:N-acetyltransferase [Micromonospora sonchi]|uniref:N-acetyltransferase n=1 Tax=Micromonospora sonchi TaxID=1763543 RepID=A0A917X207_9ACTN|nr:GNAT family N-acetyltransferase [Micromonospora sonchi]GGM52719.1 N-acetyltransferase [Micromonospora sonchi]